MMNTIAPINPINAATIIKLIGKDTVHLTRYTGQQGLDFIAQRTRG